MSDKKAARLRRLKKTRAKIQRLNAVRLSVFRSPRHIYAQVISSDGAKVLASASTLQKEIRGACKHSTGGVEAAKVVGQYIAKRAVAAGCTKVAFDRSGYLYHGRVKALAEAARENGLEF